MVKKHHILPLASDCNPSTFSAHTSLEGILMYTLLRLHLKGSGIPQKQKEQVIVCSRIQIAEEITILQLSGVSFLGRTKLLGKHEHGGEEAAAERVEGQAEGSALDLLLLWCRLQLDILLLFRSMEAVCVAVGHCCCPTVAVCQTPAVPVQDTLHFMSPSM